jgi:hypothetical protein
MARKLTREGDHTQLSPADLTWNKFSIDDKASW